VRALWGSPTRIRAFPADEDLDPSIRKLEWSYGDGKDAYVAFREGRVVEVKVNVEGTALRTRLGDGARTVESSFRARWPRAQRLVTSVDGGPTEVHYYVPGARPGYVLVFTFPRRNALDTVALMSRSTFLGPRSLWLS
jgi:hypothetical protein